MATDLVGWIKKKMHDFSSIEGIPSRVLDRLQEDGALLSKAITELHQDLHLPQIESEDRTMGYTASADTVTVEDGVYFTVGGVRFCTSDLTSRAFTIPDSSTRYLYAEVPSGCGDVVDYDADPIERDLAPYLYLASAEEDTSATKLKILKAVKGASGTTPTVTAYAADGHDNVIQTAEEVSYADTASQRNFGNVQVALDQLQTVYTDTGAANALVITPDPAITAYAAGQVFRVAVLAANTGAATININSLGAKSIKTPDGEALVAGDLQSGAVVSLVYDGTNFQTLSIGQGRVVWRSAAQVLVSAGNAATWTAVDASSYIISGARAVLLQIYISYGGYTHLRHPSGAEFRVGSSVPSQEHYHFAVVGVNDSGQFEYYNDSLGSGTSTISIVGSM